MPRSRLFVPDDTLVLDRMVGDTTLPDDPAEALATTLASIHTVTAGDSLPALPLLIDPVPALREWLPGQLPADAHLRCGAYGGTPRLLHGDYWPGNVLWQGGELMAVLDWEDAALGDPLADVACARVELCCMVGEETAERFTAAYSRHAPADTARLPWWDLYVCAAALTYMDGWGLAPDVLAVRRRSTLAWQSHALRALGLV